MPKPPLTIILASPRGFCAGVERAIAIVHQVLAQFGPPVFVRHDVVHNDHVLDDLRAKGVTFVERLDEVPDGFPVIFSAHGVPPQVVREARARKLFAIDATCPLVSKVHAEVSDHARKGRHIVLVGHREHVEVIGIAGHAPPDHVHVVETIEDAERLALPAQCEVAIATQTTLSVDDTGKIMAALRRHFPEAHEPAKADLCYATQNRQSAAKALAQASDGVVVLGGANSSNARRMVEAAGSEKSILVSGAEAFDWRWMRGRRRLGLTSAASTPEHLVQAFIDAAARRFETTVEELRTATETVQFRAPAIREGRQLRGGTYR